MIRQILTDQFRLLTFQRPSPGIATHWRLYLVFGFFITWLAGIGRYWDNPRANPLQHAGLGSVAYILFLSTLLWLLYLPLKPQRWQFRNVLLFVSLCSMPALLYAMPVERFLSMDTAARVNVWFLAVVASWRVALLVVFLRRAAVLSWTSVIVATLLPLALIIVTLGALNLEHVAFNIMAGIHPEDRTANDAAYSIVFALSVFSLMALPVLLIAYGVLIWRARRRPSILQQRKEDAADTSTEKSNLH